jgi:hypothetical protein
MNVPQTTAPSRSRLRQFAFALAAIAHVLAVFVAPVAEASADRGIGVHVEEAGTSQHHSHVDATCIVCAGHPLVAHAAPEAFRLTVESMRTVSRADLALHPTPAPGGSPVGSRAPPSIA